MKEKRRKVLMQIDRWEQRRCAKCSSSDYSTNCGCEASEKIRKYGERLMNLTAPRKDETTELINTLFVPENLTQKIYSRLKYLKVTDKAIAEKVGIRYGAFPDWKRENGIKSKYEWGQGYER